MKSKAFQARLKLAQHAIDQIYLEGLFGKDPRQLFLNIAIIKRFLQLVQREV